MNNIHYLETSAINVFANELTDFEFNNMLQVSLKFDFCLSSVGIWEILLNSNEEKKEKLIYWAQFNCASYLLKSPAEIFIDYLKAGAPLKDRKKFWFDRESDLQIAKTWKAIHKKIDKTIPVDLEALKNNSEPMRQYSRMHKNIISSMTDVDDRSNDFDYFHRMMLKLEESLKTKFILKDNIEKQIKTSLILSFFFICIGMELDNSPIRNYWKKIKLDDPFDRLEYLIKEIPLSIIRGPIAEMSVMINTQVMMKNSTNRGSLFDALHNLYCYYADNTVSNDIHFTSLKEVTGNKIYEGVVPTEDYLKIINLSKEKLTRRCN